MVSLANMLCYVNSLRSISLPTGVEMVMTGDDIDGMEIDLISPVAIEKGLKFAIPEPWGW